MIVQVPSASYQVMEVQQPDPRQPGAMVTIKVLAFIDPESKSQFHFPLTEEAASALGSALQGRSGIVPAGPGDLERVAGKARIADGLKGRP